MVILLFSLVLAKCAFIRCHSFPRSASEDFRAQRYKNIEFLNVDKAPYTVLVFGENNGFFCTGTLVTLEWVISAAHCVYSEDGDRSEDDRSVVIAAGASSLKEVSKVVNSTVDDTSTSGDVRDFVQRRRSVRVEAFPSYDFKVPFKHDLVLVKVQPEFVWTTHTQPVALPTEAMVFKDHEILKKYCDSPGFGKILHFQDSTHDYKLKSQIYISSKACNCFGKLEPLWLFDQNNWFCPPIYLEPPGLCDADNGAPFVCDHLLRGVATSVFFYKNLMECQQWPHGDEEHWTRMNECGDKNNLNLFTDLCVYSWWIQKLVPEFPVIDPTTCPTKFPWSNSEKDLFNPKKKANHSR